MTPEVVHERFAQHLKDRDLDGLGSLFDEDAMFVPGPGQKPGYGRAGVKEALKSYLPAQRRHRSSTAYPQPAHPVPKPKPQEAFGVRKDAGRGAQPTTDEQLFIKPCVPAPSQLPPLSRRCPNWPASGRQFGVDVPAMSRVALRREVGCRPRRPPRTRAPWVQRGRRRPRHRARMWEGGQGCVQAPGVEGAFLPVRVSRRR